MACIMGGHTEEELVNRGTGNRCGPYARVRGGCAVCGIWRDAGLRGRPTHADERKGAARVDRDANGAVEPGAAAGAVAEASRAAAGERGGRPGGEVDTANAVVA